ncbi:hypothetical protein LI016_16115, partial [[Eubacterium] rectale]|nr:hypothetical protein [Agathobacter rectalis]MCB6970443.1 hypothetical protein [Agathobacter rectalis]
MQRATYAHIKVESYQRQNPAQPGLLPLTAYTKLLRVCRIAYENQQRPCMDAWANFLFLKLLLCRRKHQLNTVQLV